MAAVFNAEQLKSFIASCDELIKTAQETKAEAERKGAAWLVEEAERSLAMALREKAKYEARLLTL